MTPKPTYTKTNPKRLFLRVLKGAKKLGLEVSEGTREVSIDEALRCIGFKEGDELVLFRARHYDRLEELAWKYKDLSD